MTKIWHKTQFFFNFYIFFFNILFFLVTFSRGCFMSEKVKIWPKRTKYCRKIFLNFKKKAVFRPNFVQKSIFLKFEKNFSDGFSKKCFFFEIPYWSYDTGTRKLEKSILVNVPIFRLLRSGVNFLYFFENPQMKIFKKIRVMHSFLVTKSFTKKFDIFLISLKFFRSLWDQNSWR